MGDIAARAGTQIQLLQTAEQIADEAGHRPIARPDPVLTQQQRQHIGDRAPFNDEGAVHIGFAELQLGIEQHPPLCAWRW